MKQLDLLSVAESVQRARDLDSAWDGFARLLAAGGFDRISCYFGVPYSKPFPDFTHFFRTSPASAAAVEVFGQNPGYVRDNPIVQHVRTSPRPLLRAGEDASVPFAPVHLRMVSDLRDVVGDVDINVFPLSNPRAREYGNLTVFTRRTRDGRRHAQQLRDPLHLAGLYFLGAMQARFPGEPASPSASLSRRQQECLTWVAAGLTSDEIAARLNLSRKTVDLHLAAAMRKLEAGTRAQAAARAVALGLVHP